MMSIPFTQRTAGNEGKYGVSTAEHARGHARVPRTSLTMRDNALGGTERFPLPFVHGLLVTRYLR